MSTTGKPIAMAPFQAKNEKERGQTHVYNISLLVLTFLGVNKKRKFQHDFFQITLWRYEDMKDDFVSVIKQVAAFLEKEVNRLYLPQSFLE